MLSVEFDSSQEIPTQVTKSSGYYFLPTNSAKVGKCLSEYGTVRCRLTITNTGPVLGEVDTSVAFYDAKNVRLDSETRYEEKVAPSLTYKQDFYGPPGTKAIKILAIKVEREKE